MKDCDLTLIASRYGARLLVYPFTPHDEWINLKLEFPQKDAPKENWRFAWNGSRISQTRDAKLLRDHQPFLFDWTISVLKKWSK